MAPCLRPQKLDNRGKKKFQEVHEEVITTHVNADFDALASMLAASKLYPEASLAFPGSQEKNLRNFFLNSTFYLLNITKVKKIDIDAIKRLILVDTRQKGRIGDFARWRTAKTWKSTYTITIPPPRMTFGASWKSFAKSAPTRH
jgi:nanoRNase/pAp phosphatase (c-di-AMP/oligoRNAs hydrolase)